MVDFNMQLYRSSYPWLASTENANTFGPPLTELLEQRVSSDREQHGVRNLHHVLTPKVTQHKQTLHKTAL